MKQTIGYTEFYATFKAYDRLDNFPNGGLRVLWDWLEDYEQSTGEELELDVVALCCDFCQMAFDNIIQDYQLDLEGRDEIIDYLCDNTTFVGRVGDDEVIFQQF